MRNHESIWKYCKRCDKWHFIGQEEYVCPRCTYAPLMMYKPYVHKENQ